MVLITVMMTNYREIKILQHRLDIQLLFGLIGSIMKFLRVSNECYMKQKLI